MFKLKDCVKMNEYYTLTNYLHQKVITYAMEDYLEMLYRLTLNKEVITITKLSNLLNVKKSSCSKMITKLENINLVYKDNNLLLTNKGLIIGKYLYKRHTILTKFLQRVNNKDFKLEQVEKIEHFIDPITLKNISKLKI